MDNTYLCHYGVKGMKWGVRRYQNYDGTLTDEARKRRGMIANAGHVALNAYVNASAVKNIAAASSVGITPGIIGQALATGVSTMSPQLIAMGSVAATPYLMLSISSAKLIKAGARTMRSKKERENLEKDETTGLLKKNKDLTEKEDAKRVNPGYGFWTANNHNNCGLCSVAYDLRRRGFEVSANKSPIGFTNKEILDFYKNPKIKRAEKSGNRLRDSVMLSRDTIKKMRSEPNGSRGVILLKWTIGTSGHACNYEIRNGKVDIYDGQSGRKLPTPYEYLANASDISYFRTDNLEPNWDNIHKAVH